MSAYKVFILPGVDAGVAIATDGIHATLALLAKGRSRRGGVTVPRNPQRRALWLHLAPQLCAPWDERCADVEAVRGGKADSPPMPILGTPVNLRALLQRAYSASGNYRLDLALTLHSPMTPAELASGLGLEEREGARPPRDIRWLR
jgi:hypothetical protein